MNNSETNLILCGGPINLSNLPIGTNSSNSMIPVNGKPVIGWILDDLLEKGIRSATVVLRDQDFRFKQFLQRAYARRMQLTVAALREEGTIVQSVQAGLRETPPQGLVRIILGDTLIRDAFEAEESFVYVYQVAESKRWCLALTAGDGRVIDYIDKQDNVPAPRLALSGYYHFLHGRHLALCAEESTANGERELSSILRRYGLSHPIFARTVEQWFDFGNIDNLVDARRRLLRPRYFNKLSINPILNTITKVSNNGQKLRDELNWYLALPDELQVLTPRIVSYGQSNGRLEVVQEFYGYPTLAELFVYGDLNPETWASILRHIFAIHREFRRHPGTLDPADLASMYVEKTWQRVDLVLGQDDFWQRLFQRGEIIYNGHSLQNLPVIREAVTARAQSLCRDGIICIIHGDFCLSNLLFDVGSQIIRLIDPRGAFGRKGIYGDARYDIAKLRHSVCGLYDHIIADMFELEESNEGFTTAIFADGLHRVVSGTFDHLVEEAGYSLAEIKFLEGLLFISMLPLHQECPQRQKLMYLQGLSLLNEVLQCEL